MCTRAKAYNGLFLFFILLMLIPFESAAGVLPDTGQIKARSRVLGEDASYQINRPSYTKLDDKGMRLSESSPEWVMVKDNVTGLIWEVKSDDKDSIHFAKTKHTWSGAQNSYIKQLKESRFGGFGDWRLPTVAELAYILDRDEYLPSVNKDFFPFTESLDYWSSTVDAENTEKAWRVHFCRGYINTMPKSNRYFVRAVRGHFQEENRFVDNSNGTVTDLSTGLTWQKAPFERKDWKAALEACEELVLAGHDDWRLPNVTELQSIVNYRHAKPAIDGYTFKGVPTTVPSSFWLGYWTSTNYASNWESAWLVNFEDGSLFHHRKNHKYFLRAVRGGNTK